LASIASIAHFYGTVSDEGLHCDIDTSKGHYIVLYIAEDEREVRVRRKTANAITT
jgi:hypothetical protein